MILYKRIDAFNHNIQFTLTISCFKVFFLLRKKDNDVHIGHIYVIPSYVCFTHEKIHTAINPFVIPLHKTVPYRDYFALCV